MKQTAETRSSPTRTDAPDRSEGRTGGGGFALRPPPSGVGFVDAVPSGPGGPVMQRRVVRDDDRQQLALDPVDRGQCATRITDRIIALRHERDPHQQLDWGRLFFDVLSALADGPNSTGLGALLEDKDPSITLTEFARDVYHRVWLDNERWSLEGAQAREKQPPTTLAPLKHHEEVFSGELASVFRHFNAFDPNMLWRFTSTPSSESVEIKAGTSYPEILRVIAAHSGGNDKSNERVRTLSFSRNLGAIIGVALSQGGDKQVLNIVDKASYLYGIDMASLQGKGITAHPALGRGISLFETEYVLVSTPGNPARTLNELATVKLNNPFLGQVRSLLLPPKPVTKPSEPSTRGSMRGSLRSPMMEKPDPGLSTWQGFLAAEQKMEKSKQEKGLVPEKVAEAQDAPKNFATKMAAYAKSTATAASQFWTTVQDKEPMGGPREVEQTFGVIKKFNAQLPK